MKFDTISTQNIACSQRRMYTSEREREKERQTERVRDRETDRQSMWHACVHVHMHVHAHVSQMLLSCNHMLSQNTTICVHCRNYIVCHKTHTTTTKKKKNQTSHQHVLTLHLHKQPPPVRSQIFLQKTGQKLSPCVLFYGLSVVPLLLLYSLFISL